MSPVACIHVTCECVRVTWAPPHLQEHDLSEKKMAEAEALEMRSIDEEEVKKRIGELRRMRDLLFYHEVSGRAESSAAPLDLRRAGRGGGWEVRRARTHERTPSD